MFLVSLKLVGFNKGSVTRSKIVIVDESSILRSREIKYRGIEKDFLTWLDDRKAIVQSGSNIIFKFY